ncbi:MAG: DnaA N-terminal domain-containing protein [Smithella sp.]
MQLTTMMLRTLKGAPLSVLMALALSRQPVGAKWICRQTGYAIDTVHESLLFLEENQFATRNGRYAWQIANGVEQLPFAAPLPDEVENEKEYEKIVVDEIEDEREYEKIVVDEIEDEAEYEKIVVDEVENEAEYEKIVVNEVENEREYEIIVVPNHLVVGSRSKDLKPDLELPPTTRSRSPSREKLQVDQNLSALHDAGIQEPKRSQLARLKHITPRLIRYHVSNAPNLKLAIYRIEHNWTVPADWVDPIDRLAIAEVAVFEPENDLKPLSEDQTDAWEDAKNTLENDLPREQYATWVAGLHPSGIRPDGMIAIPVANIFAKTWLEESVKKRLEGLLGREVYFDG